MAQDTGALRQVLLARGIIRVSAMGCGGLPAVVRENAAHRRFPARVASLNHPLHAVPAVSLVSGGGHRMRWPQNSLCSYFIRYAASSVADRPRPSQCTNRPPATTCSS